MNSNIAEASISHAVQSVTLDICVILRTDFDSGDEYGRGRGPAVDSVRHQERGVKWKGNEETAHRRSFGSIPIDPFIY